MRVLLVEDSATVAAYVVSILGAEHDIELLPVARTAQEGVRLALERSPDVVLMDIMLPDHNGLWAIEQIMADKPCPIVVLSGHLSSRDRNITFESLRAGAVDVLAKPVGLSPPVRGAFRESLVSTVRLMSSAVVVRRSRRKASEVDANGAAPRFSLFTKADIDKVRVVLIGASTGGPEILYRTLAALPPPLPYPVLVTQHTLEGFDDTLAQWLSCTGHRVVVARAGDVLTPGQVLLAPATKHMRVSETGVTLIPVPKGGAVASVDVMFESAAKSCGSQCAAILLTGMGRDGSAGMKALYDSGALTVAQATDTCVVSSMPESAQARGAVREMLKPDEIAELLREVARARGQRAAADVRRGG